MESIEKNRTIFINQEAYGTLLLIENQILGSFNSLMDEDEIAEVTLTGYLKKDPMPYAFIFSPGGNRNQEVVKSAKKGDKINLIKDGVVVGEIKVKSSFKYKKSWKHLNIFGANSIFNKESKDCVGSFCLSGKVKIFDNTIKKAKDEIARIKKERNIQKITALMLTANPFHRIHERLVRITIDKADLLVIFLIRSSKEDRLSFDLRYKTLKFFVENFITTEKIIIVPLKNTSLFTEHKNPELECIAAYNFGVTKVVIGQNHGGIGMFYDDNRAYTIIDRIRKDLNLEILVMPEYVYCDKCKTIVSTKTCPHGQHHHIKYHSSTIRTLLRNGILPPAILMRKEISAMILSELFPNRFANLQKMYDELFPNNGILETHSYEEFYKELANLYQTSSLT
ncbi:sulfate adenylyltransferase [Campylobacter geochelonis]|uniref:ATP-sulfurylase family protein n=1 Tax=Campylobacter geochelonis TaxID=1780362 RepID=A0A128EF91_9BACT|nr:sulfate adenylyltransferase [Campylobacter geochelonis]QKF71748.1 sulfate adenylyltransferase [Campylobacter geochelonis]CZE47594.1 ATP-sulfurylase family protein [Campylobacter geochelonis]CZE48522.1 ATP-sulfurylase family protein [Campylobacter geochelonis]CZE51167.1 ATP-sulfurylase family protein [Campylobacter geochelonis]